MPRAGGPRLDMGELGQWIFRGEIFLFVGYHSCTVISYLWISSQPSTLSVLGLYRSRLVVLLMAQAAPIPRKRKAPVPRSTHSGQSSVSVCSFFLCCYLFYFLNIFVFPYLKIPILIEHKPFFLVTSR